MHVRKAAAGAAFAAMMLSGMILPLASRAISPTSSEQSYANYSIAQLEALIAKLQKQLAEMKQGSQCFVSDKDLSLGDGEGDDLSADVRRLQEVLTEKGYFRAKPTGYFGKITRASLMRFQKDQGVAVTGEFDAATRAKLHALYCNKPSTIKAKAQKSEVKPEYKKPELKAAPTSVVQSIALAADGAKVSWSIVGAAKQGVKVVWSKNANPTYPPGTETQAKYFDGMSGGMTGLEAFSGSGTYYVRVCEYLAGSCGAYSNQVQINL